MSRLEKEVSTVVMSLQHVKVRFRLLYQPRFQKEQPAVVGSIPELGNWRVDPSQNLHQRARCLPVVSGSEKGTGQKVWETVMSVPVGGDYQWSWVILTPKDITKTKESIVRRLAVGRHCVIVHSEWNVLGEVVLQNTCKVDMRAKYVTSAGKVVGICGSTDSLGSWDPEKCVIMDSCYPRGSGKWRTSFSVSNELEIEWKLVVIDKETKELVRWEERTNRTLMVCGQWVKIEVTWGDGDQVIDTISLDFDENYNTKKILDAQRQTICQDVDAAASTVMSENQLSSQATDPGSAQAPVITDLTPSQASFPSISARQRPGSFSNYIKSNTSFASDSVVTRTVLSSDNAAPKTPFASESGVTRTIVASDKKLSPASVAVESAITPATSTNVPIDASVVSQFTTTQSLGYNKASEFLDQASTAMDQKAAEQAMENPTILTHDDIISTDVTQIRDVRPKVTSDEAKVNKACMKDSTRTKRRLLHSQGQRNTSLRNQTPCQVFLNEKSEVVSCVMLDDVTESSDDMSMQNGDGQPSMKCDWKESKSSDIFQDPFVDDDDDLATVRHEAPDGELKSTFFSFENRNQAFHHLGHHRKFTFFPAFLIFLKVINDYYWHTK